MSIASEGYRDNSSYARTEPNDISASTRSDSGARRSTLGTPVELRSERRRSRADSSSHRSSASSAIASTSQLPDDLTHGAADADSPRYRKSRNLKELADGLRERSGRTSSGQMDEDATSGLVGSLGTRDHIREITGERQAASTLNTPGEEGDGYDSDTVFNSYYYDEAPAHSVAVSPITPKVTATSSPSIAPSSVRRVRSRTISHQRRPSDPLYHQMSDVFPTRRPAATRESSAASSDSNYSNSPLQLDPLRKPEQDPWSGIALPVPVSGSRMRSPITSEFSTLPPTPSSPPRAPSRIVSPPPSSKSLRIPPVPLLPYHPSTYPSAADYAPPISPNYFPSISRGGPARRGSETSSSPLADDENVARRPSLSRSNGETGRSNGETRDDARKDVEESSDRFSAASGSRRSFDSHSRRSTDEMSRRGSANARNSTELLADSSSRMSTARSSYSVRGAIEVTDTGRASFDETPRRSSLSNDLRNHTISSRPYFSTRRQSPSRSSSLISPMEETFSSHPNLPPLPSPPPMTRPARPITNHTTPTRDRRRGSTDYAAEFDIPTPRTETRPLLSNPPSSPSQRGSISNGVDFSLNKSPTRKVKKGPPPALGAKSLRRTSIGAFPPPTTSEDMSSGGEATYASADESLGEEDPVEEEGRVRSASKSDAIPTLPSFDFAGAYSEFDRNDDMQFRHSRSPAIIATSPTSPRAILTVTTIPELLSAAPTDRSMASVSPTSSNSGSSSMMDDELDNQINEAMANFAAYEAGVSPTQLDFAASGTGYSSLPPSPTRDSQRPVSTISSVLYNEEDRSSWNRRGSGKTIGATSPTRESIREEGSDMPSIDVERSPSLAFYDSNELQGHSEENVGGPSPDSVLIESLAARREDARARAMAFVSDLKRVRSQNQAAMEENKGGRRTSIKAAAALSSLESSIISPLPAPPILQRSNSILSTTNSVLISPPTSTYHLQEPVPYPDPSSKSSNNSVRSQLSPAIPPPSPSPSLKSPQHSISPTPSIMEHFSRRRPLPACATHHEIHKIKTSAGRAQAYASKINGLAREQSGLTVWLVTSRGGHSVNGSNKSPTMSVSSLKGGHLRDTSSAAFPLRQDFSAARAKEISPGRFGPSDMIPTVPYPGVLLGTGISNRFSSASAKTFGSSNSISSKTGFFATLGRKPSKRSNGGSISGMASLGRAMGLPSISDESTTIKGGRRSPNMSGRLSATTEGQPVGVRSVSPSFGFSPSSQHLSPHPQVDPAALTRLSDSLPQASRTVLRECLTRAGGDEATAVSIYFEDYAGNNTRKM